MAVEGQMHTDILNPKDLFQKQVRYTIPAFQRPYVWSQEDQWEPLWDDVRNVAENYLEELEQAGSNRVQAEQQTAPHFLGAVVCMVPTAGHRTTGGHRRPAKSNYSPYWMPSNRYAKSRNCGRSPPVWPSSLRTKRSITEESNNLFNCGLQADRDAFRHAMDNGRRR